MESSTALIVTSQERNSRRYAKRQMTWWARDKEIKWFNPEKVQDIIAYIEGMVRS